MTSRCLLKLLHCVSDLFSSFSFSLPLSKLFSDVVDGSAITDLLNGNLLRQGVEGASDLLKCLLPILGNNPLDGLLGGLRAPLCALTEPSQTGLLGGLLGSVPILGGALNQFGCPAPTSTSASSSSTPNIAQSIGSQVTSAVGGVVSEVAGGISTVVGGLLSGLGGNDSSSTASSSRANRLLPTAIPIDL